MKNKEIKVTISIPDNIDSAVKQQKINRMLEEKLRNKVSRRKEIDIAPLSDLWAVVIL